MCMRAHCTVQFTVGVQAGKNDIHISMHMQVDNVAGEFVNGYVCVRVTAEIKRSCILMGHIRCTMHRNMAEWVFAIFWFCMDGRH